MLPTKIVVADDNGDLTTIMFYNIYLLTFACYLLLSAVIAIEGKNGRLLIFQIPSPTVQFTSPRDDRVDCCCSARSQ